MTLREDTCSSILIQNLEQSKLQTTIGNTLVGRQLFVFKNPRASTNSEKQAEPKLVTVYSKETRIIRLDRCYGSCASLKRVIGLRACLYVRANTRRTVNRSKYRSVVCTLLTHFLVSVDADETGRSVASNETFPRETLWHDVLRQQSYHYSKINTVVTTVVQRTNTDQVTRMD